MVNLEQLKESGIIPPDSKIISEHNNTIIESTAEKLVGRLATLHSINTRDTPGDICYAHTLAWEMRNENVVVSPIAEQPIIENGVVISLYPKLDQIDLRNVEASSIHQKISTFNTSLGMINEYMKHEIYTLDISEYASRRLYSVRDDILLKNNKQLSGFTSDILSYYTQNYPFTELTSDDRALVHGDLHMGNIVMNHTYEPFIIDLDSTSVGPRLYDLASWHVRSMRGDIAPTTKMIDLEKASGRWNQESFAALMGWKIISSLTHEIKYQQNDIVRQNNIAQLISIAKRLSLPGDWRLNSNHGLA